MVSHPHAAPFSAGLASALARRHRLGAYSTGVGAIEGSRQARFLRRLSARWPTVLNRVQDPAMHGLLKAHPFLELCTRLAGRIVPAINRDVRAYDCLFWGHDAAVAASPWPQLSAVYAYEDGARATFEEAARRGLSRIWDLPTPHHEYLASMRAEEARRWPELAWKAVEEPAWKLRRKQRELELSSAVAVASRFTAASLRELPGTRPVVVVPYGFPVDTFLPKAATANGLFTVLAVGSQSAPKGTHYLLEAWKRAGIRDARLRLVGPMRLPETFLAPYRGLFEHVPHVPRALISQEYQSADLLAFPTLGDGFGLVIQEAMCSATPVLTTPCGGGPECIDDGVEGWIVASRDVDALVERLRFASEHRAELVRMGLAARRRAESWRWENAASALVERLVAEGLL
jgi:alpha-maltose-1-phosphate synthase